MHSASESQLPLRLAWKSPSSPAIKTRTWIIASTALFLVIVITASLVQPEPLKRAFHNVKANFAEEVAEEVAPETAAVVTNVSEDARNTTLGFQKIFYISLPHRTDRQDAMTLMSDMVGIDSTYVEGVNGAAVPPEARIIGSKLGDGQFGCWRSHANVWRKMVKEHIASALIMEDDVDFDVDIKDQMFRISEGIQSGPNLVNYNSSAPVDKLGPYGTEWDLLFVGLCAHTSAKEATASNTPHITFDDPSIIDQPLINYHHTAEFKKFGVETNQTRLLVPLHSYYCTQGYAVSQQGARRLLYHMGYKDIGAPVDNVMSWTTEAGNLVGIAPIPPLMSQFKVGHNIDSNIDGADHKPKGEVDKEKGHGRGIKNSARAAMKKWAEPELKLKEKPQQKTEEKKPDQKPEETKPDQKQEEAAEA